MSYTKYEESEKSYLENHWKKLVVLGIILAISIPTLANIPAPVDTGYQGVLTDWGNPIRSLEQGLNAKFPIGQEVKLVNIQIQPTTVQESAGTSDLQEATTTVTLNYQLDKSYAMWIYQNLKETYVENVITPNLRDALKATTAKFTAEELITQRESVRNEIKTIIANKLQQFHIQVVELSITEFTFSPQFQASIDAKVSATQNALTAKNKLEQIQYEAQQQVIQATANATAILTLAQAQANATVLTAQASANASQIIGQQLSPQYLAYLQIINWNGAYPYYYAGGNGSLPSIYIPAKP